MFAKMFELGEKPLTDEDAAWDSFVASHPNGSILQTTNWARLKNRFNWSSHRVWLKKDGQFVAGAQILYRSAALGIIKIGYIPHGPLVDWQDPEQLDVLFGQIDQSVYQHGAGLLKMEPLVWQHQFETQDFLEVLDANGLEISESSIQPPQTIILDIKPDEDQILARMKQKTRYNIRLSARKDIVVREGTREDITTFIQLMQVTGQRDGFGTHAPEYYAAVFELFAPEHLTILIAEYEGKPLAGAFISAYGQTSTYLYGASSNEERNRMPTYAIQWAAIRWAKEKGCKHYDLWGIPDADEEQLEGEFMSRKDGLWPVYRAKRGYGGVIQRTVGPLDRVYNKRLNQLYNWWRRR